MLKKFLCFNYNVYIMTKISNSILGGINIYDYFRFDGFEKSIEKSIEMIYSPHNLKKFDYDNQKLSLRILYDGYTNLPKIYQLYFLDPLKNFIEKYDYSDVLKALDTNTPFLRDMLSTINQRIDASIEDGQELKIIHAFDEIVSDLFDGYLSNIERQNIKPPDFQILSPLVFLGDPFISPYTWSSNTTKKIGVDISFVCMPKSYSKNILLWSAIGHEVGGHDILHADKGLLQELGNLVYNKIKSQEKDSKLKKPIVINGKKMYSIIDFAADYWRSNIDETASDVCSILNIGPAAGIGLIVSLLSRAQNKKFIDEFPVNEIHPIDVLRIVLVIEVIKCMNELDVKIINGYTKFFEDIINKFTPNEGQLKLYTTCLDGQRYNKIDISLNEIRKTVKIVANTIVLGNLKTLEDHCLAEINNWTNHDEVLVQRIVSDLLNKKMPRLVPGPDGQEIYAAHILSGGILAISKSGNIEEVTNLCIDSLNILFDNNPVWQGFPIRYRSDADKHNLISLFPSNKNIDIK